MEKVKVPTKAISFNKNFQTEFKFLLKMEEKYGNCSRIVCLALREYMENHPEEC